MAPITDNQQLLEAIVAPLSGKASAAADDDTTREALAEAVLILVSTPVLRQLAQGDTVDLKASLRLLRS